jgi:hypothetical protein
MYRLLCHHFKVKVNWKKKKKKKKKMIRNLSFNCSKKDDDSSKRTAFSLVQDKLWNVLIVFFLGSRDKVINEKIDSNAYIIVAKHLNVLASIESTKGKLEGHMKTISVCVLI